MHHSKNRRRHAQHAMPHDTKVELVCGSHLVNHVGSVKSFAAGSESPGKRRFLCT